jgi:large subunit ribosomal protein L18
MNKGNQKQLGRYRRKRRVRKKISGTSDKPRLSVFRSNRHIYAQIIDDIAGRTLASVSTIERDINSSGKSKMEAASNAGHILAERAREKDIKQVIFDRGGNLYHGRVKALADGAREGGLVF